MSSITLRPYQLEAVQAAHDANARGVQKIAIGMPTGAGKTICFSKLIEERGHPALILAHRDELIQQAVEKYQSVDASVPIGIVKAGLHQADLPVVVASVQTLARRARLDKMPMDFKTIVVDEGHHAVADTYRRILTHFADVPMHAFFSATLERGDHKSLGKVIDEVVYHKTLMECIEEGYLVDIRAIAVRIKHFHTTHLKVIRGDFQGKEIEEALSAAGAEAVAVKAWLEHAQGRKTILFAPTVASANNFAEAFNQAGIPATCVYGDLDIDERRDRLADFANGKYMVVANCSVLTEGYDEPSVSCIISARPTRSKPLFIQMVGRGTRLFPGKDDLLVIDLVGNEERVDLITVPSLFGIDPDKVRDQGVVAAKLWKELEPERARIAAGLASMDEIELNILEMNVFSRKNINWLHLADGSWILAGKLGTLFLEQSGEGGWNAILRPHDRNRDAWILAENQELTMAMGIAEERVVRKAQAATQAFIDKTRSWRNGEASESQIRALTKMKVPIPEGLLSGQASDLLAATKALAMKR